MLRNGREMIPHLICEEPGHTHDVGNFSIRVPENLSTGRFVPARSRIPDLSNRSASIFATTPYGGESELHMKESNSKNSDSYATHDFVIEEGVVSIESSDGDVMQFRRL